MTANETPARTMSCSGSDLYYLTSLLDGDVLLGVDDPFPGWLTEEIREEMPRARARLQDQGVLRVAADGAMVLDPTVADALAAVANPGATLMLTGSTVAGPNHDEAISLSRQASALVASCLTRVGGDRYQLARLDTVEDAVRHITIERWGLADQPAANAQPASFSEATLFQARKGADRVNATRAARVLHAAGVAKETATAFAEALAAPKRNESLVMLRRGELAWQTAGLAMLEGPHGLWRLRSFERNDHAWVEAIPADAQSLTEEVRRIVEQAARAHPVARRASPAAASVDERG